MNFLKKLWGVALLGNMAFMSGCTTTSALSIEDKTNVVLEDTSKKPLDSEFSEATQYEIAIDLVKTDIDQSHYGKAAEVLKRLRKYNEKDIRVYRLLSKLYEKQNNMSLAFVASQEALKLETKTQKDEENYARYALLTEHYVEADSIYQQWIKSAETEQFKVVALNNLGFSALLQGKLSLAQQYFTQALDLDPLNEKARNNLKLTQKMTH